MFYKEIDANSKKIKNNGKDANGFRKTINCKITKFEISKMQHFLKTQVHTCKFIKFCLKNKIIYGVIEKNVEKIQNSNTNYNFRNIFLSLMQTRMRNKSVY